MKKLNIPLIPVITGSLALIAVIAVIIVICGGIGGAGLYITEASGTVGITSADESVDANSSEALKEGDIITVGEGASCKIVYKNKKNADDIYMILSENTQVVVTAEPKNKNGGELLLNRGSVLCNFSKLEKSQINIRTTDAKIYPSGTVSKVAWLTEEFNSYTDVYAFMGNAKIQLYDVQGNAVNTPEFLAEKLAGRVTTNDLGPVFSYLNIQFPLTDLTAKDLKTLITISQLDESFTYTTDELKAAYSTVSGGEYAEETTVSSSEMIQTAEPIETTTTVGLVTDEPNHEITLPGSNTPAVTSQTTASNTQQTTTAPVQTTTAATTTTTKNTETTSDNEPSSGTTHTVTIIIGDEEILQEVGHGEAADMPADPEISGKTFIGWDKSFDNITEDTVITALFKDNTETYHNVTIVIANRETTVLVKDGDPAPVPSTLNIEGYTFIGWDKDYSAIYSDTTITAILQPNAATQYTVTFMVGGIPYPTIVEAGGNAIAPITPTVDANGNEFIGWDKSLLNITSDMTITAMFASPEYTVTFVVEGIQYPVKVKKGETALVPVNPTTDSLGRTFIGWDGIFTNVQGDITVNAIFM